MRHKLFTILVAIAACTFSITAQPSVRTQTSEGGVILTLSHSVIAGGGAKSGTEATATVEGTIGQGAVAGTESTAGEFRLHSGFWFPDDLQPSAAHASISGRVTNLDALRLRSHRIRLVLTKVSTGETRVSLVNPFGFYEFDDVDISEIYLLQPEGPSVAFSPESLTIHLVDSVTGVDFSATPIN